MERAGREHRAHSGDPGDDFNGADQVSHIHFLHAYLGFSGAEAEHVCTQEDVSPV